jgi:hypothetical protein
VITAGAREAAGKERQMVTAETGAFVEHGGGGTTTVTVLVNNHPVVFHKKQETGAEVKAAAIAQGVQIQPDFALFEVKGPGHLKPVGDNEEVTLHERESFRAVAPDDNS